MDIATIGGIIGVLAYWEIREVFTSQADKRRSKHPRTAKIAMRTLLPLIGVLLVGQLVTEASLSVPLNVTDTTETMVELIGAVIFWSGIACAVWSRETLGKHWAHAADYQIVPGQTLVTNGPYRWVRHPMYTALLAIFTGVQVMLTSWLIILSLPLYGVMVWQGRKEEVLLTKAFGHTYRVYQKRTGMIWPRPFRNMLNYSTHFVSMNHTFAAQTDPGKARRVNQDRVECDPEGRYFLVADGMGGHPGGEEASSLAVQAAREYLDIHFESETDTRELAKQTILEANHRIREAQQANPEHAEMGTTLTIVVYREQQWWYAHVGDSRVYRWHEGTIEQVTPDHTWVAEQSRAGEGENDPLLESMFGHILFQHMGQENLNRIDIDTINVDSGDRLLLCSDGLTPELSDEEIAGHLAQEVSCEETVNALISAANENGGTDNIAVIVIDC